VCLFKIHLDEFEKNDKMKSLWSSQALKTDQLRARLGIKHLGIIDDTSCILYIYSLTDERYTGFIDLKKVIPDMNSQSDRYEKEYVCDMTFSRNHAKGSLVVYYKDSVLLFSQINMESLDSIQDESWTLIHKFDNVLNLQSIKSIKLEESYFGKLLFIINNKFFLNKTRFTTDIDDTVLQNKIGNLTDDNQRKVSFEGLFTIFQQSKPIYHPELLKQFFLKGHMKLILKILCELYKLLQVDSKVYKIPSFCELSLENIINELNLENEKAKPTEQINSNKNTAASLFNDLFSFDNESKAPAPLFGTKKKEDTKKDPNVKLGVEDEFEEVITFP
jgi:hypothetical protein